MIDKLVEEYRAEAARLPLDVGCVDKHAALLERTCHYIFSEELPPETVDEAFLDVLARAREFSGVEAPRQLAPALCVVAPPGLVDDALARRLWELAGAGAHGQPPPLLGLRSSGLEAAWHCSSAGQPVVYLDHVPADLELALAVDPATQAATSARKGKRKATVEERRARSASHMAEQMKRRRCLFALWGWSADGCDRALVAAEAGQAALLRQGAEFQRQTCKREAILEKWRAQAERLRLWLPRTRTLWLPAAPSLSATEELATISRSLRAMRDAAAEGPRAIVTVVLPVGLYMHMYLYV